MIEHYRAFFFAAGFFATGFFSVVTFCTGAASDESTTGVGSFFFPNVTVKREGLSDFRAFSATRALVIIFGAPCCFAITSLMPDTAKILRTAPQAMIPVPG